MNPQERTLLLAVAKAVMQLCDDAGLYSCEAEIRDRIGPVETFDERYPGATKITVMDDDAPSKK